jgi:cell division protein FtsQ
MAVLLAVGSLPTSSLFAVRAVRIEGAVRLPVPEVAALTGLRAGDRLFAVPAQAVVGRVSRHPAIAGAAVRVSTSGTVTVRIRERAPYAAYPYQDRFFILDRTGIVIDEQFSPADLPLVTATAFVPEWIRLGDRLPSGGVDQALAALSLIPRSVRGPGTRLRADPRGEVVLFTPDGIAVRLGPLRGLEERAALMGEVLAAVRTRGMAVEYLDLRFSGSVVMKPASDAAAGEEGGR